MRLVLDFDQENAQLLMDTLVRYRLDPETFIDNAIANYIRTLNVNAMIVAGLGDQ